MKVMADKIEFQKLLEYDVGDEGITLDITLAIVGKSVDIFAKKENFI